MGIPAHFLDPSSYRSLSSYLQQLPADPAERNGQNRDHDQQRPQAESKPMARLGGLFGVCVHGTIVALDFLFGCARNGFWCRLLAAGGVTHRRIYEGIVVNQ